jgi:hypothetical protein
MLPYLSTVRKLSILSFPHGRQCMYVTLWHICLTIVAMELQQYVPFLLLSYMYHKNMTVFIVAMEMQQLIPFALVST